MSVSQTFQTISSLVVLAEQYLGEQCGQCDCYHPRGYTGECRDDINRFPAPESLVEIWMVAPKMLHVLKKQRAWLERRISDAGTGGLTLAEMLEMITGTINDLEM